MTPRISLVAWADRQAGFIFVAIPDQHGRYVRTDKSVALVACPMCKSMVGEPCRGGMNDGYGGATHAVRRSAARRHWGLRADDILDDTGLPPDVPDEWMEPCG